ncbi:sulfide/dihydroorotate dehydrogenase-like FAD/NAD-binding protein [Methanohalophilus mahii]|uniref:Sulfide dehydrogenase (Flavoprotein) subunit SudB n=1 Tax=Methanohalophilus mahii (strain ATCC 35705 / DSM 5219 / SLP) TaxID=547558 RepID=D5E7J2_METMS|nr:sulfide/dihydroorotate dehydrogenase-like FAD/NAD-binding protein [Methanohalophilus mahii]ADE37130.1 sulfide dehydrogenase (flavoprotein) subunit SudB [Methanohalophilus mahii DSM 5219]
MSYNILETRNLVPDVHLMKVEAPDIAKAAKAGQFVILRIDESGERIPLTIADFDVDEGSITVIYQVMGKTTRQLTTLKTGEILQDFVGPLGTPSDIRKIGTVLMVGGGVGVAPVFPQARAYREAGNHVISIIGARNEAMLILEDEMAEVSDELYVATDDGSKGHHGFVTDIVKDILDSDQQVDRIVIIGPPIMMKVGAGVTASYGVETLVSLNPIMIDGTGMCGGCRVSVGGETKFACVDGPEFNAAGVDFDLLMSRLSLYRPQEKQALENYNTKCGGDCRCH